MRRLAKQQPQIRAGHTLLKQLLAAGEFALAPTTRTQTRKPLKEKRLGQRRDGRVVEGAPLLRA
jgi:hypothetical protein